MGSEVGRSVAHYSTEPPKDNPLYDPLVRFAVFALGGETVKGLSVVSYLTAEEPLDRTGWVVNPETGEVTKPRVTFWEGGSLVKATRNRPLSWDRKPGKRGQVDPTFSKGARRRMLRTFATIERPARHNSPLFVTLTAPGKAEYWENTRPVDWKRCLDTWWKRLKRAWPEAAAIWRLEPQKRGAPHFHLVVWGVWEGGIPRSKPQKRAWGALVEWVSRSWWEVWGSGDIDHLKAGTSVEVVNTWRKLVFYVGKYMAKVGVPWPRHKGSVGRLWGVVGRDSIPWAGQVTKELSDAAAVKIIRLGRKFAGLKGRRFDALGFFCDASFWHSKLSGVLC